MSSSIQSWHRLNVKATIQLQCWRSYWGSLGDRSQSTCRQTNTAYTVLMYNESRFIFIHTFSGTSAQSRVQDMSSAIIVTLRHRALGVIPDGILFSSVFLVSSSFLYFDIGSVHASGIFFQN